MASSFSHSLARGRRSRAGVILAASLLAALPACGRRAPVRPPQSAAPAAAPMYAGQDLPPIAPPAQPLFLGTSEDRGLGPLTPKTDADVKLVRKPFVPGTITVERSAHDTDAIIRMASPVAVADARNAEHRETTRSIQALGIMEDGFVRFRVGYPNDVTVWMDHGQRVAKPSPVAGKGYLVDMSPSGIRVLTERGTTPSGEEVAIIQEDYSQIGRKKDPRDEDPQDAPLRPDLAMRAPAVPRPASEIARDNLKKLLTNNELAIEDLQVTLQGTRTIFGVPCAMFSVKLHAKKQHAGPEKAVWTEMRLSGEYALRLDDAWEVELLLSGSTMTTTRAVKEGVPVQVQSAAFTRVFVQTSYAAPDPNERALEKLRPGRG